MVRIDRNIEYGRENWIVVVSLPDNNGLVLRIISQGSKGCICQGKDVGSQSSINRRGGHIIRIIVRLCSFFVIQAGNQFIRIDGNQNRSSISLKSALG
jgi:hypothetical protein